MPSVASLGPFCFARSFVPLWATRREMVIRAADVASQLFARVFISWASRMPAKSSGSFGPSCWRVQTGVLVYVCRLYLMASGSRRRIWDPPGPNKDTLKHFFKKRESITNVYEAIRLGAGSGLSLLVASLVAFWFCLLYPSAFPPTATSKRTAKAPRATT